MLRKIPFLAEASEIVYAHQERYDGSGYPRGLKGEEIPLGARIFAVADALEVITSNRPYRAAKPVAIARKEIQDRAGQEFDPRVVKSFMEWPQDVWTDLRKEVDAQLARFANKTKM
jgi:HD-GYP domain-containing protein (c-di-GMP phosphodiesterase class II)